MKRPRASSTFPNNEPIAHGFHGLTYELDGVPLPVGTSSNFSEVIDPRSIDSLEIFTGAFPAEFGGSRQGAVINIISQRANDLAAPEQGAFTLGAGNYGSAESSVSESLRFGDTRLFLNANSERTNRGIDSPTFDPIHDASNQSNQFLRTITNLGARDTLAFDFSNNYAGFQIPINTVDSPDDPVVVPPGTDDVQREYDRFLNLVYTHNSADNNRSRRGIVSTASSTTATFPTTCWVSSTTATGRRRRSTGCGRIGARSSKGCASATSTSWAPTRSKSASRARSRISGVTNRSRSSTKTGTGKTSSTTPLSAGRKSEPTSRTSGRPRATSRSWPDFATTTRPAMSLGRSSVRASRSTGRSTRRISSISTTGGSMPHRSSKTRGARPSSPEGNSGSLPVYDLQPEHDSYYEFGLAHTFAPGARAYLNFWKRDVNNVLDTTQIFPTPIFAVFNNTIGVAKGVEGRVDARWRNGDSLFFSATLSQSLAGGISGSTFLFCPNENPQCTSGLQDVTLNPEDHDQTFSATFGYTKRFGGERAFFATIEPQYGTGYPVQFQNGAGRLPPHLTLDASLGRELRRGKGAGLGFVAAFENFTNTHYLLKINNGFNTTQWGPGFKASFRITAPF